MLILKFQNLIYNLKKKIITIFGDLEWHKFPCFLIYNPKHYALKGAHFQEVSEKIQPYDVLLRRFDKYLDNGFIPGFWNHAGIYLPDKTILHAVAEGMKKEILFDFMKADHICILRPKFEVNNTQVKKQIASLLDKEYDFDFDFENGDRLSCTEVINFLFEGQDHGIPLSKMEYLFFFSRKIIIPDTIYTANFQVVYDSRQKA